MGKLINVTRNRFSVVPNEVFLDRALDYRSKGLLCTIFSLPDGWDFSVFGLVELVTPRDEQGKVIEAQKGEGKAAIMVCLQRLEQLGYLERISTKDKNGKFAGFDYKLNIPPVMNNTAVV